VALRNPEGIATAVARSMELLGRVTAPAVWLLEASSRLALRLLGLGEQPEQRVTEEEIRQLVMEAESSGVVEPSERHMMSAVMRLGDRSVRGLMTPRHELEWLDLAQDEAAQLEWLRTCRHARLPVAAGEVDELRGVVEVRAALREALAGGRVDATALMQPPTAHRLRPRTEPGSRQWRRYQVSAPSH
jgi:putative hemolysin